MNKIMKFAAVAGVMMLAVSAQASYLLWQVSSSDTEGCSFTYDTARVYAYQTSGGSASSATLLNVSYGNATVDNVVAPMSQAATIDLSQLGNEANYSFFVELSNYNNGAFDQVAKSQVASYAELSNFMTTTLKDVPMISTWHAGPYTATPEPTSAMLVMLGVGLLALKRRKA